MKLTTTKWDTSEHLNSPEIIIEYLKAALEKGDTEALMVAISNVAKAVGIIKKTLKTKIAKTYGSKEQKSDYAPGAFGNALLAYRKCEEITQKDFALKLG